MTQLARALKTYESWLWSTVATVVITAATVYLFAQILL